MEFKKKILLITTGGTIASVESPDGLVPAGSEILAEEIDRLRFYYDVKVCDLMRLDSPISSRRNGRVLRAVFLKTVRTLTES